MESPQPKKKPTQFEEFREFTKRAMSVRKDELDKRDEKYRNEKPLPKPSRKIFT
jgi:hypothetical protein